MDAELATIDKGSGASQPSPDTREPSKQGMWRRRTGLEKVLVGVCGVALVACAVLVGVVATSSSSSSTSTSPVSATVKEQVHQAKPLVVVESKTEYLPAPKEAPQPPKPIIIVEEKKTEHLQEPKEVPKPAKPVAVVEESKEPLPVPKVDSQTIKSSLLPVYKAKTRTGQEVDVCNTEECTLAAADLIQAMDTSVDPCDDFFQFACGNWIKNHPVPDDSSRWAQFDLLDKELSTAISTILNAPVFQEEKQPVIKAKTFYAACVDEDKLEEVGLKPLTDFLGQFGGWAMAMSDWDDTAFDWQAGLAQTKIQLGAGYPVNVYVFADPKDTFTSAINVDQTSLGLPRSVLLNPENYEERVAAYKTYISTTAKIIAQSLSQTVDDSQMDQDVEDLLDFEKRLAEITNPEENRRDVNRMYNPMTVKELSDYSETDWLSIMTTIFASADVAVTEDTRVIVQEKEFVYNITKLMSSVPKRTRSNYLMWRHVKSLGDETTQAMREAAFKYAMVANGVTAEEPRSDSCAELTNDYLGMAIASEYVKDYFPQEVKDEANQMVEDIRSSFESLLDVNEWMDEETKPKAKDKAEHVTKYIGYPDWYDNATALDDFYSKLGNMNEETHFANFLTASTWMTNDELASIKAPVRRDYWQMPPTTVNAYYEPVFNSITFPAGILQSPFYRANTIMALSYGGIGQVMGHELTHGFDDEGRQYDKDGNVHPWWSNATMDAFQSRAQCIVDQYGNTRIPELDQYLPNATLNGVNTQGENIADNGGLREALLAYQTYVQRNGEEPRLPGLTEYTTEQLFFLNFGNIWCSSITTEGLLNQVLTDPHSPSKYRTDIPPSNMKDFANIWECPVGSKMNPENKCVVW